MIKTSQNSQLTKESTRVRRKEKMGSRLRISLLTAKSDTKVRTKSKTPRTKPLVNPCNVGKIAKTESPTPKTQSIAMEEIAFVNEGRKNMEE